MLALLPSLATGAPSAVAYDEDMAQVTNLYSSAAYCWQHQVRQWHLTDKCAPVANFTLNETYSVESSVFKSLNTGFAYTGVDHDRQWVVAAFKGTNNSLDWMTDFWGLEFAYGPCKLSVNMTIGRVHSGFCSYYSALGEMGIAHKYLGLLEQYPSYTPVVTGHSLGGAAGVLFAYDVYEVSRGKHSARLQTFGQPRVGDYDFSVAFSQRVSSAHRVVHRHDIVPHVPFCFGHDDCRTKPGDPHHYGVEVWYTGNVSAGANYTECDGSGEDPLCSNSIFPDFSVSDHCFYFGRICGGCCHLLPS